MAYIHHFIMTNITPFFAPRMRCLSIVITCLLMLKQISALPVFVTQFVMSLSDEYASQSTSQLQSVMHTEIQNLAGAFNVHISNITITPTT